MHIISERRTARGIAHIKLGTDQVVVRDAVSAVQIEQQMQDSYHHATQTDMHAARKL